MSDWSGLLAKPAQTLDDARIDAWFAAVADRLLNGTRVWVGGKPHRFTEVEAYYHGAEHPDRFAHRDPVQLEQGRWYFHRMNGAYKSGSFKGVDVSFGDGVAHGGFLIRGLEKPDGSLVDGPSLCVDHMLDATGAGTVPALDKAIGPRPAWTAELPLRLEWADDLPRREVFRSGRVGLSLKKSRPGSDLVKYICRPYRFLSEPRRIAKGKVYLACALHAGGADQERVRAVTGCPAGSVQRYVADFEEGKKAPEFTPFFGIDLKPADLCRLHGVWYANYGPGASA
jgi:hypothetical protein